MRHNNLNTAQSLLAHIALKTARLKLFGADILVKQWTASERIKYMTLITDTKEDGGDDLTLIRPQAHVVALSLVNEKGKPLFAVEWQDNKPIFADPDGVESLVQNRAQESSDAFVEVAKFNGVEFASEDDEENPEESAAKN
tara:strand:+ start:25461 stop:25883 length:423 start_codon:yes stop_codon:yes gene_type:complete